MGPLPRSLLHNEHPHRQVLHRPAFDEAATHAVVHDWTRRLRARSDGRGSGREGGGVAQLPEPTAKRLQRPSWRDARLLVGVVLVLLGTVLGARLVAGS